MVKCLGMVKYLNPILIGAITFTSCLNLSNTLPYKHKSNQFNKLRKILLNQNCLQINTNC